ncbi:hypothetical protein VTL71DRAFT_10553 [Oculimacula yallundae]|uniref:Uncharacterized protein n=1 Tax=Oculimacula yallundae TaxID=86028 RepID=A0ABR4CTK8_9HELO
MLCSATSAASASSSTRYLTSSRIKACLDSGVQAALPRFFFFSSTPSSSSSLQLCFRLFLFKLWAALCHFLAIAPDIQLVVERRQKFGIRCKVLDREPIATHEDTLISARL